MVRFGSKWNENEQNGIKWHENMLKMYETVLNGTKYYETVRVLRCDANGTKTYEIAKCTKLKILCKVVRNCNNGGKWYETVQTNAIWCENVRTMRSGMKHTKL